MLYKIPIDLSDYCMEDIFLFTDASVDVKSKIGYGAFLRTSSFSIPLDVLKSNVRLKRFEATSSTKLELQTLLWALGLVSEADRNIIIYTDSQNLIDLSGRRKKLELNNYQSNNGRLLSNHELYKSFFMIIDSLKCNFVKVKGHQKSSMKNQIESIFTYVDRASRNALRNEIASN